MVLEDDESFFVVLDSSEPRIILNPNTSVVTILDSNSKLVLHEESPCFSLILSHLHYVCLISAVTVGFTVEEYTVSEAETQVTVCANISGEIAREVSVTVDVEPGTAEGQLHNYHFFISIVKLNV